MVRQATPLLVQDLSAFTRSLARALAGRDAIPGHVELQNLIARAAGYPNLQALKAAPHPASAVAAAPEVALLVPATATEKAPETQAEVLSANARRVLGHFDVQGRLLRWPTKLSIQRLAMWVLWTRFDAKRPYTEREVNTILRAANAFGDHVTLRRELVNHKLLAREADCSTYWKLPARPDDETRALLTACRARATAASPADASARPAR